MKKVTALTVTVVLLLLVSGCKNGTEPIVPQGEETTPAVTQEAVTETAPTVTQEPVAEIIPTITQEPDITAAPQITSEPVETVNPFEEFLFNDGKVYTEEYFVVDGNGEEKLYIDSLEGFTKEEFLCEALRTEYKNYSADCYSPGNTGLTVENVAYAYIDCGGDNIPELVLKADFLEEYSFADMEFIFRNENGRIQLCNVLSTDDSNLASLCNNLGKVKIIGGYGYDVSDETLYYLDENGNNRFCYYAITDYYGAMNPGFEAEEIIGQSAEDLPQLYIKRYFFEEYTNDKDYDEYVAGAYCCGECGDDEEAEEIDFEENIRILQNLFERANAKLYSLDEINSLIAGREKEMGISDSMKEDAELEWTALELKTAIEISQSEMAELRGDDEYGESVVDLYVYSDEQIYATDGAFHIETESDAGQVVYIIDESTCFADNCETTFFDGYEAGDTPYEWLTRAYNCKEDNPMAIIGVFEVIADEDTHHVNEMCGCYWWD